MYKIIGKNENIEMLGFEDHPAFPAQFEKVVEQKSFPCRHETAKNDKQIKNDRQT